MRLLSLFMIVGYFEIYEVLMFYHGEKLWLYSGLTEILMLALLIVINNEGCFWRNYCILILEQGMTSLLFSIFGYASPDLNEDLTKLVSFTPVAPVRACILVFGVMSLAFILSALFLEKMFKQEYDLWKPGEHSGTFRGIQLSMVAAKAGLEFMLDNNIEAETRRKGEIVREYLEKNIDGDPNVIATRGIGLLWGVEVKDDATAGAITARAFKKGLVIERAGRDNAVIKIMPPLIISDEDLIAGLDILKAAIDGE